MKKFIFLMLLGAFASVTAQQKIPYSHKTYKGTTSRRTEIILPQVNGYNCYKGDFHVHTSYSDGQINPRGRVSEAWHNGLDILAITDHYEGRKGERDFLKVIAPYSSNGKPMRYLPAKTAKSIKADFNAIHQEAVNYNNQKGYGLLLVKGCEMARKGVGHFNALFVNDLNAIYHEDLTEAFRKVKEQGGIVIHNHPGNTSKYENEFHTAIRRDGLLQGYEVSNGYTYYPHIHRRCVDEKLTMFGNTDTHGSIAYQYLESGNFRTMTIVLAKECTEEAIKEALLARRTIVYSGGDLIGEEEWLKAFLNAAVDCRLVKVDNDPKKGRRTFVFTNNCSIPIYLRRGKTIYELEPFKPMVMGFGRDAKTGKFIAPAVVVNNMWVADYKHPKFELEIDKK